MKRAAVTWLADCCGLGRATLRQRKGICAAAVLFAVLGSDSPAGENWQPRFTKTPLPSAVASTDPAVIREGEYLVKAVAHCTNCHLPKAVIHNASREVAARLAPVGGGEWDLGPLGVLRSPNLTSDVETGIGGWGDAEIGRAIKYGIDREGYALIYMIGVGPMSDGDLTAIISYLRTLAPVKAHIPPTEVTPAGQQVFLTEMRGLVQPKPQLPVTYVAQGGVSVGRGAYLANGPAMCFSCHSNLTLAPRLAVDGPRFAGSEQPYPDPDHPSMEIDAPNLTPSTKYGRMQGWTEEQFVSRIRAGRTIENSAMPWENFRLMTDADLVSIFRYLRSLAPVDRDTGPTYRALGWKPNRSD